MSQRGWDWAGSHLWAGVTASEAVPHGPERALWRRWTGLAQMRSAFKGCQRLRTELRQTHGRRAVTNNRSVETDGEFTRDFMDGIMYNAQCARQRPSQPDELCTSSCTCTVHTHQNLFLALSRSSMSRHRASTSLEAAPGFRVYIFRLQHDRVRCHRRHAPSAPALMSRSGSSQMSFSTPSAPQADRCQEGPSATRGQWALPSTRSSRRED